MNAPVFVDTNVLLYALDAGVPEKQRAAHAADCRYLLTEDLQHGQDIRGMRVVNPFKVRPDELVDSRPEVLRPPVK